MRSNAENVFSKGSGAYLRAVEFLAVFRLRDAFLSPENEKCGADAAKPIFEFIKRRSYICLEKLIFTV